MKRYLALMLCVMHLSIYAQSASAAGREGGVTAFTRKVIGVTHGETLRYSWANLNDADPLERVVEPLRIQVMLVAADGSVIGQAAAAAPSPGELQHFDFVRNQLSLPGEAGTGRLQLRVEVQVRFQRVAKIDAIALKQKVVETFPGAFEVFDSTGRTQVHSDVATLLEFEFDGE